MKDYFPLRKSFIWNFDELLSPKRKEIINGNDAKKIPILMLSTVEQKKRQNIVWKQQKHYIHAFAVASAALNDSYSNNARITGVR